MTLFANAFRQNTFRLMAGAGALGLLTLTFNPLRDETPAPQSTPAALPANPVLPVLSSPVEAPGGALEAIRAAAHAQGTGLSVAYAPDAAMNEPGNPLLHQPAVIDTEMPGLREALAAYRAGDMAKGDEEAARLTDPLARLTLDWVALQSQRPGSFARLSAFLAANPDWAARAAVERRVEDLLFVEKARPALATAWFATHAAQTPSGRLAAARGLLSAGKEAQARAIVAALWRSEEMSLWLEGQMEKEFGSLLSEADYRARALRFAYAGKAAAQRASAKAGEDVAALIKARLAVVAENKPDTLMQAVSAPLQKEPLYLLSKIQMLRRAGDLDGAVKAMQDAPRERALLGDPDEWWTERRLLARKLLDAKKPEDAYLLCAQHSAVGREGFIEAEFHAGWIALRFLNDPTRATRHFDTAAPRAETPISRARVAYWQGRAAEALGAREEARTHYRTAANEPVAYYGQLARARLGEPIDALRKPNAMTRGAARVPVTRVVEMLLALGENEFAASLASESVRSLKDEAQMAALADVVARAGDARITLSIGKQAVQRGHLLDEAAFPTFGIPPYDPIGTAAPLAVVYAIARQESAFAPKVISSAGAKGLMQMIDSTAKRTAQLLGVPFDKSRLTEDPAFNAQLGAAHLGQLLLDFRNSYILTFAAYNAGPRRAKEWIEAYGDPRDPAVDPIDWVERIPFSETRNYVQRVTENLEIYRLRFGDTRPFAIRADLRGAEQPL